MAELVQLRIENTIPELEQMERIELFTNKEIKMIIKRKKAHEYRLQRRQKTKDDYLKYINYEKCLLSLIRKRRKETHNFNKKKEIDSSIAKRISKLYKAAIVRNQKDVKLWLEHIDFCKTMYWNETISGMFTRLLQVHNNNPELWIMAAKWEMEENCAADNSRGLFQRAIRFHPESKSLWNEYFRMELLFIKQLQKKNEKLDILSQNDDENILNGKIAAIIYTNAIKTIPDVNFAISFISICESFEFAKSIEEQIYQDIKEKYSHKEETWHALANRALKKLEAKWKLSFRMEAEIQNEMMTDLINQVFQIYEERLQSSPTEKMWTFYIQMCLNLILKYSENLKQEIIVHTLNIMENASEENCLIEELFVERIKLLETCCESKDVLPPASDLVQKWPTNINNWLLNLNLHIEHKSPMKLITSTFNKSISNVPEKETLPLWYLAIEWLSSSDPSKVKDIFENGITKVEEVSVPLKCLYLHFVAKTEDIKSCRKLYKRLRNMKPLSVEFFQKMIGIECCLKNPVIKRLRKLYEDGLLEFGSSSVDLWLDYAELELRHKKGMRTEVGKIYWRAMKTLALEKDKEVLLTKYTALLNNHM